MRQVLRHAEAGLGSMAMWLSSTDRRIFTQHPPSHELQNEPLWAFISARYQRYECPPFQSPKKRGTAPDWPENVGNPHPQLLPGKNYENPREKEDPQKCDGVVQLLGFSKSARYWIFHSAFGLSCEVVSRQPRFGPPAPETQFLGRNLGNTHALRKASRIAAHATGVLTMYPTDPKNNPKSR